MKKINFIIILIFCLTANLNAQTKGILNYNLTINNGIVPDKQVVKFALYFDKNISIEVPVISEDKHIGNSVYTSSNTAYSTIRANLNKTEFVYKDFNKNKLVLADNIGMNYILINDTLSNFKWIITNEHEKFLKYKCTKATTNFRGRQYIAWFADDIAIQNGPWKFCGLPGLILKVSDLENNYVYEITSVNLKADFDAKIIDVPEIYKDKKAIDHKGFIERYQKKVVDLEKESKASITFTSNSSGMVIRRIPPKIEKF